jgi:hypothetical protein
VSHLVGCATLGVPFAVVASGEMSRVKAAEAMFPSEDQTYEWRGTLLGTTGSALRRAACTPDRIQRGFTWQANNSLFVLGDKTLSFAV